MISNIREKSGEKLESGVNLLVISTIDLLENKIE
jgi:hypothetical protein